LSSLDARVGLEECGGLVVGFVANTALISWYAAELFLFTAAFRVTVQRTMSVFPLFIPSASVDIGVQQGYSQNQSNH